MSSPDPTATRPQAPGSPAARTGGVVLLTSSLEFGGAERQLVVLATGLHRRGRRVLVVTFAGGPLEADLRGAGVPLRIIEKSRRGDWPRVVAGLVALLRRERPVAVHSYLDVPNLVGTLAWALFPRFRLVWGIRASNMDQGSYGIVSRVTGRLSALASRVPARVVANSRAGRDHHAERGWHTAKMRVIPNGIDTDRFHPNAGWRAAVRAEWGVADHEPLVGLVGRLDPMKDHGNFLRAAARVLRQRPDVRFVCVGGGPEAYLRQLRAVAAELGLEPRLTWSPARNDMPAVYNALDLLCSSSAYGEGFPNVVGEAMASGVPCVVTDVGDAAWVVGDTGGAVPPRDEEALAGAILRHLDRTPGELRDAQRRARARAVADLGVERLLTSVEEVLWDSV